MREERSEEWLACALLLAKLADHIRMLLRAVLRVPPLLLPLLLAVLTAVEAFGVVLSTFDSKLFL